VILTMPLLEGLDGTEKMSKSLGNYVGVTEPPGEIFGKIMSISDQLMFRYYELLTDRSLAEIEALRQRIDRGELHPMEAKMDLARSLVATYHSAEEARAAEEAFRSTFQQREIPEDLPLHRLSGPCRLSQLMVEGGLVSSRGEATRLIKQGAVEIDGSRVASDIEIAPSGPESFVLRVGKRRFLRVARDSAV
jgi:tyrosyl-tRNA synthetase